MSSDSGSIQFSGRDMNIKEFQDHGPALAEMYAAILEKLIQSGKHEEIKSTFDFHMHAPDHKTSQPVKHSELHSVPKHLLGFHHKPSATHVLPAAVPPAQAAVIQAQVQAANPAAVVVVGPVAVMAKLHATIMASPLGQAPSPEAKKAKATNQATNAVFARTVTPQKTDVKSAEADDAKKKSDVPQVSKSQLQKAQKNEVVEKQEGRNVDAARQKDKEEHVQSSRQDRDDKAHRKAEHEQRILQDEIKRRQQ